MGEKTNQLIEVLTELRQLTSEDDQEHWVKFLLLAETRLKKSDFSGIEHLLAGYGGLGSFNDVWIQSSKEKDERFCFLRSKVWDLANYIKENHEFIT
ncbi:DUF6966 domain-containing protein [Pseudoalteromonas sp. T1lg10]|uniref:DUF6966 domain-containing protein n=1 Tax=Pseudoalteromonas sp. T1lg10 TaxID=2077093 RepID=UPI000CF6DE02|nr:hypothetical protein [Pseudoalteromonas sp. T1lg10]